MTTNTLKEKVLTIAQLQKEAEESLDRKLVARFIDFILANKTMGMVDMNFGSYYSDYELTSEANVEFNVPDFMTAEYLDISDFSNPEGVTMSEDGGDTYFVIPFEYFEDPDAWEDTMRKRIASIVDGATKALDRVFPNLSVSRTTFHTIARSNHNLIQIGFPDLEAWTFRYDGASYGGRYCIGYDMATDNLLYLDSASTLGITDGNSILSRPLSQEEIDARHRN